MEKDLTQKTTLIKSTRMMFMIIVVILTALAAGGGLYAMQKSNPPTAKSESSETDTWNTYTDPKYEYSIQYPKNWFHLSNSGAPDTDRYFSNENVESPFDLGSDGIWMTIRVSDNNENASLSEWVTKSPGNPAQSEISNVRNTVINGVPAIQQEEDFTKAQGTERGYSMSTYLMKGKTVYSISCTAFLELATLNKYEYECNTIVESFTFTD